MHFEKCDLQQLTSDYLKYLPPAQVIILFCKLREDHFCLLDRVNQNSTNSSRPSSSQVPWEKTSEDEDDITTSNDKDAEQSSLEVSESSMKRKPGKQPGSKGFGRTQKFTEVITEIHRPICCGGCGRNFCLEDSFKATTGHETIDIKSPEPGAIGIIGYCIKHIYGNIICTCGFETTSKPNRCDPAPGFSNGLRMWTIVGPRLAALIVFVKLKLHLSLGKTKAFLKELGISLSKGTISNTIVEAGQAASDLEPSILEAIRASKKIYVDETSWKENQALRWLWCSVGETAVYFSVGKRTVEKAKAIIGNFNNWLMTDGYGAYRGFEKRARCWAHLERKARGLAESSDPKNASFGKQVLLDFASLKESIYRMRELTGSNKEEEQEKARYKEAQFLYRMLIYRNTDQMQIRAFAREILNDSIAIFSVIENPDLPLTNNAAERALRPMVIMRKISQGTKVPEGSQAISCLASVYETLLIRRQNILDFLEKVFRRRRQSLASPPLP